MRQPCPVGHPTGAFEKLGRPATVCRQTELVVLDVLCEVGVEAHVEALGQLR
jgi:hypothetical protein